MVIEVVGYKGVVGNATYQWLKAMHPELEVVGRDKGDPLPVTNKETISYICTPEAVVTEVCRGIKYADLIVVRSTVLPGTCINIQAETGIHVCHMPEFVLEATAVVDEFRQDYIILGACCGEHAEVLQDIYSPYIPLIVTDRETSEVLKLVKNCYLACLISFWNEVEEIARIAGTSGHKVGKLATLDDRVVSYGASYHHKYGGTCLPKDIKQLREYAKQKRIKSSLLDAIVEVNECQKS